MDITSLRRLWPFEEEILQLIDRQDDVTRSDLQGCVSELVRKIYDAGKEDAEKKGSN
jgi:hypothetical protein